MPQRGTLAVLQNEECKIDSISQSWATISGAGNNDKKYIAMESLENHLVDKEIGIIKLLDPPFEKSKLEPGFARNKRKWRTIHTCCNLDDNCSDHAELK